MKDNLVNRRKLLGIALGATSSIALADNPVSIIRFLQDHGGEAKVKSIVLKHFPKVSASDQCLGAFYRSLLAGVDHNQDREFLLKHMEKEELEDLLEVYVVEEFVVSTNYLDIHDGKATKLKLNYA